MGTTRKVIGLAIEIVGVASDAFDDDMLTIGDVVELANGITTACLKTFGVYDKIITKLK